MCATVDVDTAVVVARESSNATRIVRTRREVSRCRRAICSSVTYASGPNVVTTTLRAHTITRAFDGVSSHESVRPLPWTRSLPLEGSLASILRAR